MAHKKNILQPPYLVKHTLLLILMLHFRMCRVLNFTQNSFMVAVLIHNSAL